MKKTVHITFISLDEHIPTKQEAAAYEKRCLVVSQDCGSVMEAELYAYGDGWRNEPRDWMFSIPGNGSLQVTHYAWLPNVNDILEP